MIWAYPLNLYCIYMIGRSERNVFVSLIKRDFEVYSPYWIRIDKFCCPFKGNHVSKMSPSTKGLIDDNINERQRCHCWEIDKVFWTYEWQRCHCCEIDEVFWTYFRGWIFYWVYFWVPGFFVVSLNHVLLVFIKDGIAVNRLLTCSNSLAHLLYLWAEMLI